MPPILYDMFQWPLHGAAVSPRTAAILLWVSFGAIAVFSGFFLVMRLVGRFRASAPRAFSETAILAGGFSLGVLVWLEHLHEKWLLYYLPLPLLAAGLALFERYGPRSATRRRETRVRTRYLAVELDYEAGVIDGKVLKGSYRGAVLSELSSGDLRLLQVEVASDPDSVNILNAFLDHARAAGRQGESSEEGAAKMRPGAEGAMSEDEAWSLLGLTRGASVAEIKAAYRRLMKQVHPDQGGTDYLAYKINQAKNLLLRA